MPPPWQNLPTRTIAGHDQPGVDQRTRAVARCVPAAGPHPPACAHGRLRPCISAHRSRPDRHPPAPPTPPGDTRARHAGPHHRTAITGQNAAPHPAPAAAILRCPAIARSGKFCSGDRPRLATCVHRLPHARCGRDFSLICPSCSWRFHNLQPSVHCGRNGDQRMHGRVPETPLDCTDIGLSHTGACCNVRLTQPELESATFERLPDLSAQIVFIERATTGSHRVRDFTCLRAP